MADRFEDLRNFVTVAESGGINAAAERLGIAKSAVSRRLADFEQRIGLTLARRGGRRFELTSTGVELLADARRVLSELERLETRGTRAEGTRPLLVSVDRDLVDLVVAASAKLDREQTIEVRETPGPPGVLTLSIAGRGDIGGLRPLQTVGRGVYAAEGLATHVSHPADLRGLPGISVATSGDAEWRFDGVEASPEIVARLPDLRSGLTAAAAGLGLIRLPRFAAMNGISAGALREIIAPTTPDLTVTVRTAGEPDLRADRLLDEVGRLLGKG